MIAQDLGLVTAYAYAVSQGYTGTEEEFAELMASYATVAERAEAAATAAETAQGKAEDAQTAAEGAQTAAETAQGKAEDAQGYAEAAETAAETAQGKAEDAQTAAEGAQTAAETAQGKAEAAQTAAEGAQTAAESAQGYAEGYATAASGSASASSTQALKSEGYAVGTQDGTPVASGSPYYEYNSKYFADLAAEVAESIPEDYSDLSDDVTALKCAVNELDDTVDLSTDIVASGGMVAFNSGTGVVKSIAVDTAGASAVITRCGRNICPKYTSGSANGLTWTVASDGTITFTGTPTADTLLRLRDLSIPVTGTDITLSMNNNLTNSRLSFFVINPQNVGNKQLNMTVVNALVSYTNLTQDAVEFRIRVPKDFNATGLVLKPMVELGASASNYEEYAGQTYSVTLDDGVVQEQIPTLTGINTIWSNSGAVTVTQEHQKTVTEYVAEQIATVKQSFYRFITGVSGKYLYVYYKSGDKYVRWELHNVPTQASNSDTWQIGRICGVDGTDDSGLVEIVRGGEFELAFKENGAADYCGGNNHGDETTDTFILHIDGKQIADLTTLDANLHPFNRIDAFEIATVNRCNTPAEDILKHQKIWIFENGKVKVRQTIKYLEQLVVDTALVCMFPALRSAYTYGIRKGGVAIEDMTTSSYTKVYTVSNDVFYEMYGNAVTAKIHAVTDNPDNGSTMWINNTEGLNKLYYGYYGVTDSSHPTTVPADTVITAESEYDVAYTPQPVTT